MTKWCILQNEKMPLKVKLLIFNILRKPLIFRVFATGGESVRKYALIFGVYKETKSEKSKNGYNLKVANIVSIPREENLLSAE